MTPKTDPPSADQRSLEERTRADFSAAMAASLQIVTDAVARGGAAGPPAWPAPAIVGARYTALLTDPADAPAPEAVTAAVLHGWLVSGPPTDTTPQVAGTGPLVGMTLAVKDVIDIAGLPTRNGTSGAAWRYPARSAAAWDRLATTGASCLGKAATHEMAWGVTTEHIPNPAGHHHMPGGSSGGSAACVAAGITPAALGTDTGGSIRIPAALCGVVGLRPTVGSAPLAGITPLAPSQDVVGPLARDVVTCGAVAEVLLGRPLAGVDMPDIVAVPADVGALSAPAARSWQVARRVLTDRGVAVVEFVAAPWKLAAAVSLLTMLEESAQTHGAAVRRDPLGFGPDIRALLTVGLDLAQHHELIRSGATLLRSITSGILADTGARVILTPTTATPAPLRGATTVALGDRDVPVATALTRFTSLAAAAGLPAISVPVPGAGLPTGLQVMAAPGDEATCLAVARWFEAQSASG